jgi:hypothetical protein
MGTGNVAKKLRVEVWNGSRDDETQTSSGYVFVKSVDVATSSAFAEPENFNQAFIYDETINNPLATAGEASFTTAPLLYKRELTAIEKKFNAEQTNAANKISYAPKIVWAQNDTLIYAIYNNLQVTEVNPYDSVIDDDTPVASGCTAETDPSTFWLSFSSILLVVALFVSIVMLFIKNIRIRRKARKNDAKSHYTVKSRIRNDKKIEKETVVEEKAQDKIEEIEQVEEIESEEVTEEISEEETAEQTEESYVYGEVQDFGETEENKED